MDHKHDIVDEVVRVTENHVPILREAFEVHAENHLAKAFLGLWDLETVPHVAKPALPVQRQMAYWI